MKRALCAAVVAALTTAGAHASSATVLPASGDAVAPLVAVDPSGVAYVAATLAGATRLWSISDDGAVRDLAPGGVVSALPGGRAGALAIDTAGYPHLAEMGADHVTVRRSIDGGGTWDRGTVVPSPSASRVALATGRYNSGVEGATLTLAVEGASLSLWRSIDGGLTFTPRAGPCARSGCTLGDMITDPSGDEVWLAYASGAQWQLAHSTDGATTFSTFTLPGVDGVPSLARSSDGSLWVAWSNEAGTHVARVTGDSLSAVFDSSGRAGGAHLVAGALGTMCVAWFGAGGVEVAHWDGATFGAMETYEGEAGPGRVALAADPQGGYVVVVRANDGLRVVRA